MNSSVNKITQTYVMTEAERQQQINLNKKLMDYSINTVTQTYVMTENANDVLNRTRHVHIMTEEESHGLPTKVITIGGLRDKFLRVIADLQDTVFDLRAERNELEVERDLWKENSQSNRDKYNRLAAERDKLEVERDLWEAEAERWRDCKKP